jgi:exodeoxyribonuclease VII large subunit
VVPDDISTDTHIHEVGEFYELLTAQLESAYGKRNPQWVRGEIAKVYEKGHIYIDLVDAGSSASDARRPMLGTHCWQGPWASLKRKLTEEGITLKPGMVVNFLGYVDVYAPQGKIGFTIMQVDVEGLLGDAAKKRAELIAKLHAEGIVEANKKTTLSPVPLHVGLVASPGTEGYSDFTGQLLNSGYGFEITLVKTAVQGDSAPPQIVSAIQSLDAHGVDIICLVRGGGSKGDLSCFDDERIARAIAASSTPVFTGIGHTGDESIADIVAHTRAITPTKLGEEIAALVSDWHQRRVIVPAQRIMDGTTDVLEEATQFLAERRRTMIFAVRDRLRGEQRHLGTVRQQLLMQSRHILTSSQQLISSTKQLLSAYDPKKRMAQGWSVTTNASGRVVKSLSDVAVGENVRVLVSDGSFDTTVNKKDGTS